MAAMPSPAPGGGRAQEQALGGNPKQRRFLILVATGGVVVLAGFLVPYLLPRPGPTESARPAAPAPAELRIPTPGSEPAAEPLSMNPDQEQALLMRLGICTLLVVGLLVGVLLALRRWLVRPPSSGSGDLQVLGVTRIDSRSQVFLVQARGQRLLVGADFTGVKLVVLVPPGASAEADGEEAWAPPATTPASPPTVPVRR